MSRDGMRSDSQELQLDFDLDRQRVDERGRGAEEPARFAASRGLQRAFAAMAGNEEFRLLYAADPAGYMSRFGIPMPALANNAVRPADPDGSSGASSSVVIGKSPVHGDGVFAEHGVRTGEVVSKLVVGDDVAYTASKVNQSASPNAVPVSEGGELTLRAARDIPPGQEVLGDYPFPGK